MSDQLLKDILAELRAIRAVVAPREFPSPPSVTVPWWATCPAAVASDPAAIEESPQADSQASTGSDLRLERDGKDTLVRISGASGCRVLIAVDSGLGTFTPMWCLVDGVTSEIPAGVTSSLLSQRLPLGPV